MGVLDVTKHLGGNGDNTSNWVEELLDQSVPNTPAENPPTTERSRPRQRIPNSPRPSSYGRGNGRKAKGSKSSRRQENASFLTTLIEEDGETEVCELDITDFVTKTATVFASLFTDNKNMEMWVKFIELSETEQEEFLNKQLDRNSASYQKRSGEEVITDEERVPEQGVLVAATAEKCFMRIEERIRKVLSKKRIPMGELKYLEEELLFSFQECPEAVVVSLLPSSFERLMMHGVCQYLGLLSSSDEYNGVRHMEIENNRETFNPPDLSLSQYLVENR